MPTLQWIGKEAVVSHADKVPFRVLERKYTFGSIRNEKLESRNDGDDDQISNSSFQISNSKIIHGDNLEALKALLPQYEGKIKCIYIDPPYNTGNENWVYNDNVNSPRIKKWLGQVVGKEAEDLTRHDKWLCMMYPRLVLLQKLLSPDGAIFISIDDNEQANLKLICDEIFGAGNFVGEWFWYKSATPPNLSYKIKKNLEYIFCYEKNKSNQKYFGVQKSSKSDDPITKPQNSFKILTFAPNTINFKNVSDGVIPAGVYGTAKFPNKLLNDVEIRNGKNVNEVSFENRFIWIQETLNEQIRKGTVINCSKQLVLSYKKNNYDPEVPPNLIDDSVNVSTTEEAGKLVDYIFNQNKVFDFPKPPSLVEYLINFLCDKSSIILDSFAGSGTTAHAVLNLNKADGGNRKFILVEMEDYAETITAERVKRVIDGYGDTEGTGGGFDYYELGETIFNDDKNLNENIGEDKIREYIWFSETHKPFQIPKENDNGYFLGKFNNCGYWFYYQKDAATTLDDDFLKTMETVCEQYIIYADKCILPKDFMKEKNIIFKKIPRDVKQL